MKIITWNINGIRSINGQNPTRKFDKVFHKNVLFEYIEREDPDMICLQETKASPDQLKEELRFPPGYVGEFNTSTVKKGYSGVVTYSKKPAIRSNISLAIEKFDVEGRIVESDFGDFVLYNVYFPNGTSGQHRVDYKLEFYDALFMHIEKNVRSKGKEVIVCGDYNIAHHPIDLARPKENENTSGFLKEERVKLDEIVNMGYHDAFRMFNSEGANYTWWSHRARARENNVGWRIDYHFVSDNLKPQVRNSYHQPEQMGSDHCPVIMEIDI